MPKIRYMLWQLLAVLTVFWTFEALSRYEVLSISILQWAIFTFPYVAVFIVAFVLLSQEDNPYSNFSLRNAVASTVAVMASYAMFADVELVSPPKETILYNVTSTLATSFRLVIGLTLLLNRGKRLKTILTLSISILASFFIQELLIRAIELIID